MIIVRALRANRTWLALGLFGVLPVFGGCDSGDPNTKPVAAPQSQAQQDAERTARENYMKTARPTGPAGKAAPAPAGAPPAETPPPK